MKIDAIDGDSGPSQQAVIRHEARHAVSGIQRILIVEHHLATHRAQRTCHAFLVVSNGKNFLAR